MDRLAELREKRALTLRELAELSGVAVDTINQIELGHRKARPSTLRKLAKALGVEVRELFEEPALSGKAEAPMSGRPEETPWVKLDVEDRIDTLESFRASILAIVEKLGEEFTDLQKTGDRESLLTLFTEVAWTGLGIVDTLEDEDAMREYADESEAELRARDRVRRALARLEDLSEEIEATVDALEEKPATVAHLAAHRRRRNWAS